MKIENTQVFGFESAVRAMRNPLNSHSKSDSKFREDAYSDPFYWGGDNANVESFDLGEADKTLSQRLTKAGSEHNKHMRLIQVWADITLPRFVWVEWDTYRHVEKVSESTMHTLMKSPITEDMFEGTMEDQIPETIDQLSFFIEQYNKANDPATKKSYKYRAKMILPESFLQKRTINTNYQCLLNMYKQRKNHELPQWHEICKWILELPYFKELTGIGEE